MAQGQISKTQKKPIRVFCSECRRFNLDTSGNSRSNETGEFFMGRCSKLHSDVPSGKLFAKKSRYCDDKL